jgi:hypothetical protein
MSDTTVVPDTKEWKALQAHYETARALKLRDLFAADPGRAERANIGASHWLEAKLIMRASAESQARSHPLESAAFAWRTSTDIWRSSG